jgi:hypothetical protein
MKKSIGVVILLLLLGCETGVDINTDCVLKHTSETLRLQSTAGSVNKIIVNISWYWIWSIPAGDGVIIERRTDANYDSIGYVQPLESLMTFTDTSAALQAGTEVSYALTLLTGRATEPICTTTFDIPQAQNFFEPDTDIVDVSDDTLLIVFGTVPGFDSTSVAIYQTSFTDIDSFLNTPVDQLIEILTNPVIDTALTDTVLEVTGANTLLDTLAVYAIKISSSKILDLITDTSIGLKPFIRQP